MSGNTLFMLGVIHRDKEGPSLLRYWLNRIQPDSVTLELSYYGIRFRKKFSEKYTKRIDRIATRCAERSTFYNEDSLSYLLSYIHVPYEYEVVSAYGSEHNIPFYTIDMDFFSYIKLRRIEDLLSEENIEQMLLLTETPNSNLEITAARLFFEKGISLNKYDTEMYIRDRYMSSKIRDLMKYCKNKKFLHVCGWQHLQDPSGVYTPLNPIKVFSHDKTICI